MPLEAMSSGRDECVTKMISSVDMVLTSAIQGYLERKQQWWVDKLMSTPYRSVWTLNVNVEGWKGQMQLFETSKQSSDGKSGQCRN